MKSIRCLIRSRRCRRPSDSGPTPVDAPADVAGRGAVQVVPVAASARRRPGVLRPSRRAADGRLDRLQSRSLVPRLRVLQAPPHAEEARSQRIPILEVQGPGPGSEVEVRGTARTLNCLELRPTPKIPSPARPTRRAARAAGTSASAGARPATAPSSRTSPPDRSARRRRAG